LSGYVPDLTLAFQDNWEQETGFGRVSLERRDLGMLVVPTGKLIACDAFIVFPDMEPFQQTFPTGRYPVIVSIAHIASEHGENQRVAYATLRFSDQQPAKWEMAVTPGQDVATLDQDEIYGYGVDTGTGCYMDTTAVPLVGSGNLNDQLYEALRGSYVHTWSWANITLDSSGLNMMAFSTGDGDGAYAAYVGYDAAGKVATLVTDFGLFPRLISNESDKDGDNFDADQ
jgi:hypothetical protein